MQIEIWSDIVCPFCYIGKRKFEAALEQFENKNDIEVVWKSYLLNPNAPKSDGRSIYEMLSDIKGISLAQSVAMHQQVSQIASEVGLQYNFDIVIPANTFLAHQFIHFAKTKGKQAEAEESLFKAYFTEGKDIGDVSFLVELGGALDLNSNEVLTAITEKEYKKDVQSDMYEAHTLGIRSVPFFLFNSKYAVSGAQSTSVFTQVIEKSYDEWKNDTSILNLKTGVGATCDSEGCDQ